MNIPLHYQRKLRKVHEDYVGHHDCGWVTDGRFMVKDTLRPQFRKIKSAPRQMDIARFENITKSVSSVPLHELVYDKDETIPGAGPFVKDNPTSLLCVKLVNSEGGYVYLDKVYYDYFTWINCTFATTSKHDYIKPVAILYKDEIVGYVMGVRP